MQDSGQYNSMEKHTPAEADCSADMLCIVGHHTSKRQQQVDNATLCSLLTHVWLHTNH